jgi:hypothetical protein
VVIQVTQVEGIGRHESSPQELPKQSRLMKAASLAKMMFKNASELRKLRVMGPNEERYVRPPREYQIPPFHEDMRYSTSNEPYLRPTRWCNPREPEVIAMANELGAFELSDHEFADAAFWFVKTKMVAEMLPLDSVSATLKRGTGTCYHLISVFIALCRAAGIKARYKTFRMKLPAEFMNIEMSEQEAQMVPMFNMGMPEGEGEAYIDGEWVVAHVAMRPELFAVNGGLPITKLGEDSIDMTFELIPGTIKRFESIPLRLGIALKAGMWLAPATMERANISIQKRCLQGRLIIEKAGGIEAYDQNARRIRELYSLQELLSTAKLKRDEAIVFEND